MVLRSLLPEEKAREKQARKEGFINLGQILHRLDPRCYRHQHAEFRWAKHLLGVHRVRQR